MPANPLVQLDIDIPLVHDLFLTRKGLRQTIRMQPRQCTKLY